MSRPVASINNAAETGASPQYAEVAFPLRVAQTFTYRLPLALRADVQIGARLLVPFGRKLVTGYTVALHAALDPALELDESEIKEAEELLDAEPLLTPEVLEITRWISDYYAAPWGEVLKAALPAGLNSTIEQILSVTAEGRDELARLSGKSLSTAKARTLQLIADESEIAIHTLAREMGQARSAKLARELERAGWITSAHRARSALARIKRQKAVRLRPLREHAEETARAFTATQERIIETLIATGGEMFFAELLEAASVSASTIQTLERRGVIEVYAREVRRDPLAGAMLPDPDDFVLTSAQAAALHDIESALRGRDYAAFLLHGVTGSGKTEIYIRAMRAALE
ncbi:MAG: hypothetical protein ACR2LZ_00045, partial [Pyrinomonadaceae bacterium]